MNKPRLKSIITLIFMAAISLSVLIPIGSCASDWTVTITASISGKNSLTTFGVDSAATSGFDPAFDQVLEVAPPRGAEYLETCVYHSGEPSIVRYLTKSVVNSGAFNWMYQVESYEMDGTVTFSWVSPSLPEGYTLVLKDSSGSVIGDMTDISSHSFIAQKNTLYTFHIVYAKETGSGATNTEPSQPTTNPYVTMPPTTNPTNTPTYTSTPKPDDRLIPQVPDIVVIGVIIGAIGVFAYLALSGGKGKSRRK